MTEVYLAELKQCNNKPKDLNISYAINIQMDAKNIQFTKIELKIAKYLFKHFKDRFNPRQLGRLLEINHAHANKLSNQLVEKIILKKEEIGNGIFFSFNYENKMAIKFIEYLLSLEGEKFPEWLNIIAHNLRKFNDNIDLGLIFGSSVKSKKFNDIDVLLVYNKKQITQVNKIKNEIRDSQLIEHKIRYVDITKEDILLNKNDKIFYEILSKNLIFYNAEKYVEMIKKCQE